MAAAAVDTVAEVVAADLTAAAAVVSTAAAGTWVEDSAEVVQADSVATADTQAALSEAGPRFQVAAGLQGAACTTPLTLVTQPDFAPALVPVLLVPT